MRWIWIDRFVEFTPGRRAVAVKNVSLAEDHLHDHWGPFPIMPCSLMIEGMAQTAGVLVGQARDFKEKVILAKVSLAEFNDIVVPGDQITYRAEIDNITPEAAVTTGTMLRNGKPLGHVNLIFSHIDQNLAGAKFPKDNFVFTSQFERLVAPFLEGGDG
ncbi:MAG: beta-hydroxyacyl-ACP dehydratase [Phycisphaerae bacterium]|jgi:3-hydroxyacyl-[acyl-carrier-protein] dehydratase|nr:beta-hydroxyacyl-ACP dehydratase [Phycisphaerae bacterium]